MAEIQIADSTLARLQKLAVPLVDTVDTLINRLADVYENRAAEGAGAGDAAASKTDTRTFGADSPPDLTHTKILSAKLNGLPLGADANWNGLLKRAILLAKERAATADDLKRLISVNYVVGRRVDEGFKYLAEADLSVQGQDARGAWRGTAHIAQQLGIPVEVVFMWRHKDGAAFPGQTGHFTVNA